MSHDQQRGTARAARVRAAARGRRPSWFRGPSCRSVRRTGAPAARAGARGPARRAAARPARAGARCGRSLSASPTSLDELRRRAAASSGGDRTACSDSRHGQQHVVAHARDARAARTPGTRARAVVQSKGAARADREAPRPRRFLRPARGRRSGVEDSGHQRQQRRLPAARRAPTIGHGLARLGTDISGHGQAEAADRDSGRSRSWISIMPGVSEQAPLIEHFDARVSSTTPSVGHQAQARLRSGCWR